MNCDKNEIWKDIPDYEGLYQVSNLGRVKRLSRLIWHSSNNSYSQLKTFVLKTTTDKEGYVYISLIKNKNRKTFKVHQLVAMAFLGHKPCGLKMVVDHINDNPSDNRVENLQIVTTRFNSYKTQGKYSSQYKGVSWSKQSKKWHSIARVNGLRVHLGYFSDEYDAHLAYQNTLKQYNLN